MKSFLLLMIMFLTTYSLYSQNRSQEFENMIKKNKVKTLKVYFFRNEKDSILTDIKEFDTSGFIINSKMIDSLGNVITNDSSFYDNEHYLLKKVHYFNGKKDSESTLLYSTDRKMVQQIIIDDSTKMRVNSFYDENNRLIKSIIYDDKGDSTLMNTFYNKQGLNVKTTFFNKVYSSTVIYKYNSLNKISKKVQSDSYSKYTSEFIYNLEGDLVESTTTSKLKKTEAVNKSRNIYNPNGLISETKFTMPNNSSFVNKTYYTFY